VRTVVFALMAAAILLGIVQGEHIPFTAQLQPGNAALLARGGDNVAQAYYLSLGRGVPADQAEILLFWANDLYLAALEADPHNRRASLSAAILFRELGQPDEVHSLLRPLRPGEVDERTRRALGQVNALLITESPALGAVEGSREYLTTIGPGPLLTAAGYRAKNKPDLAKATLKEAARRARPLLWRFIAALAVDGAMVLCGLVVVIGALIRRRTRGSVAHEPIPMSPSWGTREAIEAVVLWVFLGVLLSTAANSMAPLSGEPPAYLLLGPSVLSAVVAIGWVWAVARFRAGFGWYLATALKRVAIGVGATGLAVLPVLGLYRGFQLYLGEKPSQNPALPLLLIPDTWVAKALLVLAVGIVIPALEETLFRGILFGGLRRRWSFWPAALATAALFAVVHLNLTGFVAYLLLGLLFASLFERSRSLVTPWAAHAAFNIFNVMMLLVLFG